MKSNSKLNNFIDIYFKSNRQAEDFADQKKKTQRFISVVDDQSWLNLNSNISHLDTRLSVRNC